MAIISYVGVGAGTTGTSTDVVINVPADVAVGDVALAFWYHAVASCTVSTPATGWAVCAGTGYVSRASGRFFAYYKVLDGTEGATETWVMSASGAYRGGSVAYRNVRSTSTINTTATAEWGTEIELYTPSVTTSVLHCHVVGANVWAGAGARIWNISSGTERLNYYPTTSSGVVIGDVYRATASAGSPASWLEDSGDDTTFQLAWSVALTPAEWRYPKVMKPSQRPRPIRHMQ